MVLDRRMFRRPSQIAPNKGPSSRGVGITSGLTRPVKMETGGDVASKYRQYLEELSPITEEMYPKQSFFERAGMSPFQFFAALGTPMQPGQTVLGKIGEAGQYLDIKPESTTGRDLASKIALEKALESDEDELITVGKEDRVLVKDPESATGYREIISPVKDEDKDYEAKDQLGKLYQDFNNGAFGDPKSEYAKNVFEERKNQILSDAEGTSASSAMKEIQQAIDLRKDTINPETNEIYTDAELQQLQISMLDSLRESDRAILNIGEEERKLILQNNNTTLTNWVKNVNDKIKKSEDVYDNASLQETLLTKSATGTAADTRTAILNIVNTASELLGKPELIETSRQAFEKILLGEDNDLSATEALKAAQSFATILKSELITGNKNIKEFETLELSGAKLTNSREGQELILKTIKHDAAMDILRDQKYKELQNTGKITDNEGNVIYEVKPEDLLAGEIRISDSLGGTRIIEDLVRQESDRFYNEIKGLVDDIKSLETPIDQRFLESLDAERRTFYPTSGGSIDLLEEYGKTVFFVGYADENGKYSMQNEMGEEQYFPTTWRPKAPVLIYYNSETGQAEGIKVN